MEPSLQEAGRCRREPNSVYLPEGGIPAAEILGEDILRAFPRPCRATLPSSQEQPIPSPAPSALAPQQMVILAKEPSGNSHAACSLKPSHIFLI